MYYNFADLDFVNQELAQIWPGWTAVKVLGKGGFGAVYEIHRNVRGNLEKAALKIMRIPENDMEVNQLRMQGMTEQNTEDYYKKSVDDTYKEIAIMQKFVGHSHLVSYEDYTIRKRPKDIGWDIYIRMELLTGLVDYARNRTLDEETVLKMGVHISQGLSVCHKKGVIHRDIKPQNIFVNENGDFKLGDFGVSRKAPGTHDVLSFKGTLAYMAPEVYRMLSTDERSDIYSLGVVLYQCLNDNRLPFVPDPFTPQDLETARMRRFNGEQIPEPAHGSPELKAIILKSLEVSPEDRFQTAEEMYYALSDIYRRDYGRRFTTTGPKDTSKRRTASALETTVLSDSGSVSSSSGSVSSGTSGAEPVHVVRGYTVTDSEADAESVSHSGSMGTSQSSGSMGTGQQSSNTGAGQSSGSVYGSQPSGNTGSNQVASDSFASQSGNTGADQDGNTTGRRRYVSTKGTSANKQQSATYEGAPAGGGSTPPKKPDDKKKIIMIIAAAVAVLFLVLFLSKDQILKYDQKGMFHKHQWEEATCTRAKTCTICGAKTGRLAEHQWVEATCTEPKTCSVCGKTEGEPAGHDWKEATCTKPKTCSVCGETEGEALGHDWLDATYDEPKTCARCGETEGSVKGYVPFTEFTGSFSEDAITLDDYQVYPIILEKELIGCRKMQIGYTVNEVEGDVLGEFQLWGKSDGEWVVLGTFDVTEEDQRYVNVFTIDPVRNISEIVCKPSTARGVSSWNCYYNLVDAQVTVD